MVIRDDPLFDDEAEDQHGGGRDEDFLSDEQRELLVKRLVICGLPTREVVRITGASGRTVARSMQRFGIKRKKPERHSSSKKCHAQRFNDILTRYFALEEVTLDALAQLAGENNLSLKALFDLLREHVSPSRWAIRTCLGPCGRPALTSSPGDRYCPACKKKIKKDRIGIQEDMLYN